MLSPPPTKKRPWYLCVQPAHALGAVLHSPVEVHGQHVLRPRLLPGVPVAQPVIRLLHLEGRQVRAGETVPGTGRPCPPPTLTTPSRRCCPARKQNCGLFTAQRFPILVKALFKNENFGLLKKKLI